MAGLDGNTGQQSLLRFTSDVPLAGRRFRKRVIELPTIRPFPGDALRPFVSERRSSPLTWRRAGQKTSSIEKQRLRNAVPEFSGAKRKEGAQPDIDRAMPERNRYCQRNDSLLSGIHTARPSGNENRLPHR